MEIKSGRYLFLVTQEGLGEMSCLVCLLARVYVCLFTGSVFYLKIHKKRLNAGKKIK